MRLLIYALGGGLGHLARVLSLARAAARRGHASRMLANSALAAHVPLERALGDPALLRLVALRSIDPALDRDGVAPIVRAEVASPAEPFDALVVDTFPRGLGGELHGLLEGLAVPRVLVHRDIAPAYVAAADLRRFVARRYDAILVPGEAAPLQDLPAARRTAPFLLRDAEVLLERQAARAALAAPADERPLALVVASGMPGEAAAAHATAERLAGWVGGAAHVRLASVGAAPAGLAGHAVRAFPLLESLRGVDLLVGAGGYNTVHEARATGTPLVAVARGRLYDRQAARLSRAERAAGEEDLLERAAAFLERGKAALRSPDAPRFENGAGEAVRTIEGLVGVGYNP